MEAYWDILHREIGFGRKRKRSPTSFVRKLSSACAHLVPGELKEDVLDDESLTNLDKVFASCWLTPSCIFVGTKCNKLLQIDIDRQERYFSTNIELPYVNKDIAFENCGIHSITVNPSKTLLASGGRNPCHFTIYDVNCSNVNTTQAIPVQTLVGHTDWVFGSAWTSDTSIITASRDRTIACWKFDPHAGNIVYPVDMFNWHESRVRDLKYDRCTKLASSISVNGLTIIWDPLTVQKISQCKLPKSKRSEVTSLAMQNNVVVTGARRYLSILDTRCNPLTATFVPCVDTNFCVRSLSFFEDILTIGGSDGRISFFDLRSQKFLDIRDGMKRSKEGSHLRLSDIKTSNWFNPRYERLAPACYTHCWNMSGPRLFAGGGPHFNVEHGCYMGIWS